MEVVKSYLKESVKDFNLFRSPPKVVLKPDATLMCLGLVPASRLFWCWSPEPVIKPEFVSHLSSFESVHKVYKEEDCWSENENFNINNSSNNNKTV
jgi:hypothetical protein